MSAVVQSPPVLSEEDRLWSTPIRDLGLKIEGTSLEPVLAEFRRELAAVGMRKLQPHFYLTTQWIVHDDTIAIGIPFYLARPDLTALHAQQVGHVGGVGRTELLRYLRHEMGHVVNYAYQLYQRADWTQYFGKMSQPYEDDYRPEPFNRKFVIHLPGWYAQKHPDEDWAETFAVWMTPSQDWQTAYAAWPEALRKLQYCDHLLHQVLDQEPIVTDLYLEEEVGKLDYSLREYYQHLAALDEALTLPNLDGALRTLFERLGEPEENGQRVERLPVTALVRKWERTIMAEVYRWTGHFRERIRVLLHHLAERADALQQQYPADREPQALLALTALVTALAMNHVQRGSYVAE